MDQLDGLDLDVNDEEEQDQFDGDDGENTEDPDGSAEGATTDAGPADKRINDLMSKWQRAEADNQKLRRQLAAQQAQGNARPPADAPGNEWITFMRQTARDQIFASEPRLARYGFEPDAISGETPAEMQAALTNLRNLIDRIETDASNRALKRAGLTPSAKGSTAERGPEIPEDDEAFEALVAKAKGLA